MDTDDGEGYVFKLCIAYRCGSRSLPTIGSIASFLYKKWPFLLIQLRNWQIAEDTEWNILYTLLPSIGLPVDSGLYNTLLQVYLLNEHVFSPSAILEEMKENDVEPNQV